MTQQPLNKPKYNSDIAIGINAEYSLYLYRSQPTKHTFIQCNITEMTNPVRIIRYNICDYMCIIQFLYYCTIQTHITIRILCVYEV